MAEHDRDVEGIARRETLRPEQDRFGAQHVRPLDREHLVCNGEHRVESGLNGSGALDRGVTMQYLL